MIMPAPRDPVGVTTTATTARRPVGVVAAVTTVVGTLVLAYGLLLVPLSALGGLWIAAVGLSLVLSGAVASPWLAARLDVPAGRAGRLSLAFALFAGLLLVAFVLVNGVQVEPGVATG